MQADGATGTTIQPGDVINGGAGTDTLSISVAGGLPTADFTISAVQTNSVEKVILNNFDTHTTRNNIVDTALMSGLNTVGLSASSAEGDTIFSNMTAIVAAEMKNGSADLTLTYGTAAVAGTADTQALTVSNVSAGTFTANGSETIAITSELVKSTLTNVVSDKLKTVTAAGAVDLTISTALTATTINAAAMTGALNVTLGTADQAVTGGAGADVIDAVAALTSADTIVGGAGTDTLKMSVSAAIAVGTAASKGVLYGVSGVEVLDVASTNDAAAVSLDSTVGVTTLKAAANVKTITITDGPDTTTETISFTLNGQTVKTAVVGTDDETTSAAAIATAVNLISGFSASSAAGVVTITATTGEAVEISGIAESAATDNVYTVSAYKDVTFTNLAVGQTVDIYSADAVTASLKDASGTADSLTINLATVAADKGFAKTIGTVTANNIETLNLNASGMTDVKITTIAALTGVAAKTLNITGDSDVTISAFTSSTALTTIDGSTASGDLNLAAAPAAKDQSIKTGSGNDTIVMGAFLTAADTIDGGANNIATGSTTIGVDKLTASGDIGTVTTSAALKIANVETIEVAAGGAAATYIDAAGITGATTLAFSATSGTVTVTNLAAGTKIGLGENANLFAGAMDIALANATGTADSISFTTGSATTAAPTVALTIASAVETVNIAATTESANVAIAAFTNTNNAAKNIVLTAGHANDTVALGTLNAATTNVDASALAAKLTVTTAATGAVTVSASGAVNNGITTGAGADTITLAGKLGVSVNVIDGGAGTDVLNATADVADADFTSVSNIETINLTIATGTAVTVGNTTAKMTGFNAAKTITLLGGDALSSFANGATGLITDAEKTIDASAFGGSLDLTLAVNALDADMTIKGGALLTDKVTTSISTATTGEVVKSMTGVETLVINSATTVSNARIDLANVTGLTALQTVFITGASLSQIAVDKLASGVAVKTTGTVTNDNLVIDLTDKAAADNALSLEIGGVAVANDILNIDAAGVETLNIKASNTNAATLDLAGVAATASAGTVTVNVTGAGGLIFKTLSALTNVVNASAATGAITLASADRAATAMTVTTGTGADSVAMRHANDVLNGGLGTDTLVMTPNFVLGGVQIDLNSTTDQITTFNGSANAAVQIGFENVDLAGVTGSFGADVTAKSTGSTITGTANADVITGGAAADTIVITAGNDAITGGGGDDIFKFTNTLLEANEVTSATLDGGAGTADAITLTVATTGLVDADFRGITNVETLNLLSAATNTITLGTIATNTAGIVNIVAAGTGNDTITTGVGSHTVTTAAGTDSIVVTASVAAAITSDAAIKLTTINDWAASDALTFTIGATNTFTTAAINVTAATTLLGALDIAVVGAGNTNNLITWFQLGGNTYIVNHTGASSDLAATDVVVKLIGTFDLSDETFAEGGAAASTLTFA